MNPLTQDIPELDELILLKAYIILDSECRVDRDISATISPTKEEQYLMSIVDYEKLNYAAQVQFPNKQAEKDFFNSKREVYWRLAVNPLQFEMPLSTEEKYRKDYEQWKKEYDEWVANRKALRGGGMMSNNPALNLSNLPADSQLRVAPTMEELMAIANAQKAQNTGKTK